MRSLEHQPVSPSAPRSGPYRDVAASDWNDWSWQLRHKIRDAHALAKVLPLIADDRAAIDQLADVFPMGITPYYAALIDPADPADPIRAQCVPSLRELEFRPDDVPDPLAEDSHMPVAGLTHRYPDRALLYATHHCAVYCRHCNRRRKVGDARSAPSGAELGAAVAYLRSHGEIRDVLLSGGDPLTFSDAKLDELLTELRSVPHLEIIRLATRQPVTLPMRVTPALGEVLKKHHPIYVSTHFNHLRECTPEAGAALELLANAGCAVGNQMVLLKGVNEDPAMVKQMNQWLLKHRCRPYYIFQCDSAEGVGHFRTPVASGLKIIDGLRGWTSGLAVPQFVVDLPGGGGKVPLVPNYLQSHEGQTLTFRNYAGETYVYGEGEADPTS